MSSTTSSESLPASMGQIVEEAVREIGREDFVNPDAKAEYLHIRVSPRQRLELREVADRLGLTVSALLLRLFEHAKPRL